MFSDDANLFLTHQDIRYLFRIVNQELENINQCFISNNLSLNINIHFFINPVKKKALHFFTKTDNRQLQNTTNDQLDFLVFVG